MKKLLTKRSMDYAECYVIYIFNFYMLYNFFLKTQQEKCYFHYVVHTMTLKCQIRSLWQILNQF